MRAPGEGKTDQRRFLTTERLLLREWEFDDWRAIHAVFADPAVSRFTATSLSMDESAIQNMATRMVETRDTPLPHGFVIVRQATQEVIGTCRLARLREGNGQGEIAYFLGSRYWNQSYGTETARALLEYGFQDFGLHRIRAVCHPENIGSWRIMEKIGMRREAHHRFDTWNWQTEQWDDSYVYAILEDEWLGIPVTNVVKMT